MCAYTDKPHMGKADDGMKTLTTALAVGCALVAFVVHMSDWRGEGADVAFTVALLFLTLFALIGASSAD